MSAPSEELLIGGAELRACFGRHTEQCLHADVPVLVAKSECTTVDGVAEGQSACRRQDPPGHVIACCPLIGFMVPTVFALDCVIIFLSHLSFAISFSLFCFVFS
jgi:hypothetical protein